MKSIKIIRLLFLCFFCYANYACKDTLLNDKQIITFGFDMPNEVCVINEEEKTIVVTIPLIIDISKLTPVINVSSKATVTPASGVVQDFTESVIYTVTAEDGSIVKYTVIVNMIEEKILGKWELIAQGYYNMGNIVINPVENSGDYVEFFPDGKMKNFCCEVPYKTDEQFLYENYTDKVNAFIYKYELDNDKLTLEYVQGNMLDIPRPIVIWIYKRINK